MRSAVELVRLDRSHELGEVDRESRACRVLAVADCIQSASHLDAVSVVDAGYEWLTSHAYRRGVATLLDSGGATARVVADQLGHAQVSMTQDRYLTRRASNEGAVAILESAIQM
jgi:integrase